MIKVEMSKTISAPREILWEAIVDPDLYRQWTTAFDKDSDFDGEWSAGSRIDFFLANEEEALNGMTSEIAVSNWPEAIEIRHLGLLKNGAIDKDSAEAKKWIPASEDYSFVKVDDHHSTFTVTFDVDEENREMFISMWEKALVLYAEVCESLVGKPSTICIRQKVRQSPAKAWEAFTNPKHVTGWNFAHESWHCPTAENDLRVGGEFHYIMSARDGSASFDFWGTYSDIIVNERLTSVLGDGRHLDVKFIPKPYGCLIEERFEAESTNGLNLQRGGWSAILKNLASYAENLD